MSSRQVCGCGQEARAHHEDDTNVERHNTKATGFLSINSPRSQGQEEVLLVVDGQLTRLIGAKAAQQMGL